MKTDKIIIKGARVNNLKNISCEIPKNKLVVITGLSGSGKSSLAFDTIYAEGQRRYAESLSSYARQFMDLEDKPDVDEIINLSPTITISGRTVSQNPRSTVGTITEIYDYLRLLFARAGTSHCKKCGNPVTAKSKEEIVRDISALIKKEKRALILVPLSTQKNNFRNLLKELQKNGYKKVRRKNENHETKEIVEIEDLIWQNIKDKDETIEIEVVAGEISELTNSAEIRSIIDRSLELGNGMAIFASSPPHQSAKRQTREKEPSSKISADNPSNEASSNWWGDRGKDAVFSSRLFCEKCRIVMADPEPNLFSFNNPRGACPKCTGLGVVQKFNPDLIMPNKNLTLEQGAIQPLVRLAGNQRYYIDLLRVVGVRHGFSADIPVKDLPRRALDAVLYGTGEEIYTIGLKRVTFDGVIPHLEKRFAATDSEYLRKELENYMYTEICPDCCGKRLNKESLSVTFAEKNISEFTKLSSSALLKVWGGGRETKQNDEKKKSGTKENLINTVTKEIKSRLKNLVDVNLDYLTLDRPIGTLSGGEIQRVRLATQLNSELSGVIYILDEPSIGLHPNDTNKLIEALIRLRDNQNTVIVVEHDADIIKKADWIIDVGPGAGPYGGEIVAEGELSKITKNPKSLTGQYLSGSKKISLCEGSPEGRQIEKKKPNKKSTQAVVVKGASAFNLKNIDARIPLKQFVCVTGVSGSGKSTLILEVLAKALRRKLYHVKEMPAPHKTIQGMNLVDKVIIVDQTPIGRTPRSNPATYTGVFSLIRDFYAGLPESKMRGYDAGKFSFNIKDGGRCLACGGEGYTQINMQFLPDMFIECRECQGRRYNPEVLEIHYKGKNIADILDMTVKEAREFFSEKNKTPRELAKQNGEIDTGLIYEKLGTLEDVGLGYLRLGQPATKLSGGEAQRVKLATELSRRETGKTMYILDEPTTGLHFADINKLLNVLNALVLRGNSVIVIEHNLDVIKCADWIIDLGPGGGEEGGYLVAEGAPRDIAKNKKSITGEYLKKIL